jgi:hypothetical protein
MSHIQKFGAAAATSVLLLGTFGAGGAFADEQPTNVTPAATQQTQGTPHVVQGEENNTPTPNTPAAQQGEGEVHVSTVAFRNGVGTSNPAANFLVEFNDTGQGILRVVNTSNAHSDDTWLAEMSAIPQGYELGSPSQGEIASGQALIDAKVATSEHVSPDGLYWYIGTLTPGQSAILSVNKVKEAPAPAPAPAPESPAPSPEQTTPAPEPSQDTNTPAPEATTPSDAESPATPADAAPTGDVTTPAGEHVTGDDTATPQSHEDSSSDPTSPVSDGASTPSGDSSTSREGEIVGVETVNATGAPNASSQNGTSVSQGSKSTTSGKSGRTVKGQRLKTGHAGVASVTTPDPVGVASGVGAAVLAGLGAVFGVRAARRRKGAQE